MNTRIKQWFAAPIFEGDEMKTRRASFLNAALLMGLSFLGITIPIYFLDDTTRIGVAFILSILFFVILLLRYLMCYGKVVFAGSGMVILVFLTTVMVDIINGTVHAPATVLYVFVIIMAGALFGWRGILISLSACSLAVLGLILAENAGILPLPIHTVTITNWITYTGLFGLIGGVSLWVQQTIQQALARAEKEITERKKAETELRENRKFLADLIEYSAMIVFAKDKDGRYELVNRRYEEVIGIPRAGIIGSTDKEIFSEELAAQYRASDVQVLESGQALEMEDSIDTLAGKQHFFTIKFPLRADNGSFRGVCGIATDITARWEAEQENIKLRNAVEYAADVIFITDKNGIIEYVNPEFETVTGYSRADALGKTPRILKSGLMDPSYYSTMWASILSGGTFRSEVIERKKNGEIFYYDQTISPIVNARGVVTHFVVTGKDVTERKRAEKTLKDSEQFTRNILDSLLVHIAILDGSGEIKFVNRSWREFAVVNGSAAETVSEGCNYLDICDSASGDFSAEGALVAQGIREVMRGGRDVFSLEYPCHSPDKERWFNVKALPFKGGDQQQVIVIHEDITELRKTEAALRESHARQYALFESARDAIFIADPQTSEIIDVNSQAEVLTGFTRAQLIGRNQADLHPSPHHSEFRAYFENHADNQDQLIESQILTADKRVIPVEVSACPVQLPHDRVVLQGIFRNIAERKQSEEKLRRSEAQFRAVIDLSPIPYALNDGEQNITYLNAAFTRTFGYDLNDIPTLAEWRSRAYPNEEYRRWVVETWQTRLEKAKTEVAEFEPIELNICCKDGATRTARVAAGSFGISSFGIHLVILYDITDRKAAEDALKISETELRALINAIPDLVWLKNGDGVYLKCNQRFESFFGSAEKDIVGKTDYDFVDQELADFFREHDQAAMFSSKPTINEEQITFASDGHQEFLETIKTPIYADGGHAIGVLGIGRNITERKQAEEEIQRLYAQAQDDARIKADLLNEVNHRVKNNLTRIQSIFKLKNLETGLNDREQDLLTDMQIRIGGMLAVHNMLSASLWSPLELGDLCWQIVRGALGSSPIKSNLALEISFQPESCAKQMIIPGQATTLALILNELAMNSVKYAFINRQSGRIQTILTLETENGNNLLHLTYRDDGLGWSDEVISGQREGLGLRLIRGSLQSLPQSRIQLLNEDGAVTVIQFKLAMP